MKTYDSKLGNLMEMIKNIMDKNQNSNYSPDNMDSPKAQDSTTVVPANKKALPLEGGNSTKMVICRLSNMRSAHQNSMNSSSIRNSRRHFYGHQELIQPHKICV